jgi:hypothetical protein
VKLGRSGWLARCTCVVEGRRGFIMTRTAWLAAIAAIWLTSIGLSVIDIRQIDRQRRMERPAPAAPPAGDDTYATRGTDDEPVADAPEPSVLLMAPVTIVAEPEGLTLMQGRGPARTLVPDDFTIGPGVVTHPVAIPHDLPPGVSPPRPR